MIMSSHHPSVSLIILHGILVQNSENESVLMQHLTEKFLALMNLLMSKVLRDLKSTL